jgi:predicted DCC family thiol-disulfide oxidoreductase YuxK
MNRHKDISPWQFTAFRILFGSYLFVHFVHLLPWANELFGSQGVLADARLNPLHGLFPNPLVMIFWPSFPILFVAALSLLAVAFAAGFFRRTAALLLWFGWACLFNRNNLIANPGIPYVGLLLVLAALVPPGEPLSFRARTRREPWSMPTMIFWCPWLLLALGYTYSGVWKLFSPSWIDGTALLHLIENPLARPGPIRDWLLFCPAPVIKALTWTALAGEILFLPLCATRRGRGVAWLWMLVMHIGILLVVDFADLTFGMVMVHLFTFDPAWFPPRAGRPLLFFDGQCAMCNGWVQFVAAEERSPDFSFAPLRSDAGRSVLSRHAMDPEFNDSIVLVEGSNGNERVFTKSTAVLRILDALGGFWRVVSWLRIIPRPLRDGVYDFVAARRLRWFGQASSCSILGLSPARLLN